MRQVVFNWQPTSTTSVAQSQTVVGAGSLNLNGTLSSPLRPDSSARMTDFGNSQRYISLSSLNNLSAVVFTISGYLNGKPISVTINGPNSNTVDTSQLTPPQLFNSVTSITNSITATAVSAGMTEEGSTNLYTYDHHATTPDMSVQVVVTGTITYQFDTTNDNANTVPNPTWFQPISNMVAGTTTNQYGNLPTPIAFARIKVTAGDDTGSLVATLIQQGLGDV